MSLTDDIRDLVPIYQESIDAIIDALGKNMTLYFPNTIDSVTEEFTDPVRQGSVLKPSYKESNTNAAPEVTYNTTIIKALIQYNPSDYESFDIRVSKHTGIVRLKTFLSYGADMKRCEYMIPSSDSVGITRSRYRLLRDVYPKGLQEDRYCITFWEQIG